MTLCSLRDIQIREVTNLFVHSTPIASPSLYSTLILFSLLSTCSHCWSLLVPLGTLCPHCWSLLVHYARTAGPSWYTMTALLVWSLLAHNVRTAGLVPLGTLCPHCWSLLATMSALLVPPSTLCPHCWSLLVHYAHNAGPY